MTIDISTNSHLTLKKNGVAICNLDEIPTAVMNKCIELGLYTLQN